MWKRLLPGRSVRKNQHSGQRAVWKQRFLPSCEALEERILLDGGPPPAANVEFVQALYQTLLGRTPQASEVNWWTGVLNQGVSHRDVAHGFLASQEYGSDMVRQYYHEALGREPEPAGLAWWVAQGSSSGYDQQLLLKIQASDEYYKRQGGGAGSWITALYADDLKRPPDTAGETYWLGMLNAGFPRTAITGGIVNSHESHLQEVKDIYGQFLERSPEPAGLASWVAVADSGMTPAQIMAGVLGSVEFAQHVAHAPPEITATFSPPVLQSVERYGPAGQGCLLIHGSLANTAPLGSSVMLDLFAREPGKADRLLGSQEVTQTAAGSNAFTVNLPAEVANGTVLAAAVHGRADGPGWSQAVELPDGGPSRLNKTLPETVTIPASNGESVTLESPGHPLENIHCFSVPGLDDALPLGLMSFTVTHVPVGGSAVVRMTLPADVQVQHYYKHDPATGLISPFDFDGHTGAEIHGQVITLHLVDGGAGDEDHQANGVIVDPGGPGTILSGHTGVVPAATTGEMVTLQSAVYPFVSVQSYNPPKSGVVLPLGLFGFSINQLPLGGKADVQMTLPNRVWASRYIRQDPVSKVLSAAPFGASAGSVEIHGHVITLHLVDGGPGDEDHLANGTIVDPSGPGGAILPVPCDPLGSGGWSVLQSPNNSTGSVSFNSAAGTYTLTEGNSFQVSMSHSLTIPSSPSILTFNYNNLVFDTANQGHIKDAFEAAFVDANGNSLVAAISPGTPGRNAFFNITAGLPPLLAPGVTLQNGRVNLDISKLFAGSTGYLVFRLVNNDVQDGDTHTTVTISCTAPPAVTEVLANDTAPPGGPDIYRHDLLTNDPTVTGSAKAVAPATMAKLEASVDGGAYTDITSVLNIDQYTWNPVCPGLR